MKQLGEDVTRDWRQTLYLRLTVEYGRLGTGTTTARTEDVLEFEPQTYFALGCVFPTYDLRVIVFRGAPSDDVDVRVAPFDTGGMAAGWVRLYNHDSFDQAARAGLVAKHSMSINVATQQLPIWIDEAYATPDRYATQTLPDHAFAPEVDASSAHDRRSWSWEARTAAQANLPVTPLRAYLTYNEERSYKDWVTERRSEDEAMAHLDLIESVFDVSDDPIGRLLSDLQNGRFL